MIERDHLAILRAIDEKGSVTAAAQSLFLTQSALSHAVKKLEQQLGTPLWEKEGRNLRFTQAGKHLLGVAQRVLPQLERAEERMLQYAKGERGTLHIGMECHPCYQWLLKVVEPYLQAWPDVDVNVKQKFQFGGIGALLGREIDMLVTPDPVYRPGLHFTPVFDYEQVLVVGSGHRLAGRRQIQPQDLADEILITYPVETDRLDIFNLFLRPAGVSPLRHKTVESSDIMLQMVACGRGVAALPRWFAQHYLGQLGLATIRLGSKGLAKQLFLGLRQTDLDTDYVQAFIDLARQFDTPH